MTGKIAQLKFWRSAVATQRWILSLLLAAMISVLAGCSSGSTANVQNPPPPPQSEVAIAFQPEPTPSLDVGFSENVTAVVTNDPNNYGVDWTLTCQNPPNCGALSALHTASGTPTTYSAPSTISGNTMGVEVVALATADHTKNVIAPLTVSTFDSSLPAGTYVLQVHGVDSSLNPYQLAGAIVLDGDGNITNGEQTTNYFTSLSILDTNLTGAYFLGNDGRGTITINTSDNNIGGNGIEAFAFVFLNNNQLQNPRALISQIDLGAANTGASASGTMDLQTSQTAFLSGSSYAFVMNGAAIQPKLGKSSPYPIAFGGIFNISSGNIAGLSDEIYGKELTETSAPISSTAPIGTPDSFGQVVMNLTAGFGFHQKPVSLQLTGYIVDASHIKLIESDYITNNVNNNTAFGLTGGIAIAQTVPSGGFSNTSLSGAPYVFGVTGVDLCCSDTIPSTLTAAGLFTADGIGDLTSGYSDTFLQLNCAQQTCKQNEITGAQISQSFTGGYSIDSTGRAVSTSNTYSTEPKPTYNPTYYLYLTGLAAGGGDPAALVLADGDVNYASFATGVAYQQSGTVAFSGDYGMSFMQENGSETDGTAQMNANSADTPPLFGFADASNGSGQDNGFLGTFLSPSSNLPFSGTLYANPNATFNAVFPLIGNDVPMAVNYYFIDLAHMFWIETDLVSESSGQVSLGYDVARIPVCARCP
jgi:hypothetical protein